MSKRKEFEQAWFKFLKDVGADKRNAVLYEETFGNMSNPDFDKMVQLIAEGELTLPVLSYNMEGSKSDIQKVMALGEKMGIKWFQRLILTDGITREPSMTPVEYLVLRLQVRRQIQHLVKKRSTATSNRVIDYLTGQVTGDAKSASLSLPELTALNAKGNQQGILELIKVRGGDDKAYRAMVDQLRDTGGYSLDPIMDLDSRPKVVEVTNSLLHGMMLDSNI